MARPTKTQRASSDSVRWLSAALASTLILISAPSWAYRTGLCTANGVCSVYAYVENGDQYLLSDQVDLDAHPNMTHFLFEEGRWRAWSVDGSGARGPGRALSPAAFDAVWGPAGGRPVAGDWNGSGYDGVGVALELSTATRFVLANISFANRAGPTIETHSTSYLIPVIGGTPIVGDWDGDGVDSVGVYKDGVFTLANNSAPSEPFTMDFVELLPIDPVAAAAVRPMTYPWRGDGIDYVSLVFPDRISAASGHIPGYVSGNPGIMYMKQVALNPYDPGVTPVVIPGASPEAPLIGAFVAPIDHCFIDSNGDCEPPTNPEDNGGAIRPGRTDNWIP